MKRRKFGSWVKPVLLFPCMLFLGVGGGETGEEEADKLAAEEAERERLAAAAKEEPEDRGDNLEPEPKEDELDPEILAAIAEGEPEPSKTPPKHVPYDRFSEKVALAKELEERAKELEESRNRERAERERLQTELDTLKGAKPETGTVNPLEQMEKDLDELQNKYEEAFIEGEEAQRRELRAQINKLQRNIIKAETVSEVETKNIATEAQKQLNVALSEVLTDYPFLDPKHPDAFAELNDDIINYRMGLEAKGIPKFEAIRKAADKFAPSYSKEKGLTESENDIANKKLELEKAAREKAALASRTQPASLAGVGKGARASELTIDNVASLDEKTFDSIPDSELRKARGD